MGRLNSPQFKATESAGLQSSQQKPAAATVGYTPDSRIKHHATSTKDKSSSSTINSPPTTDTSSSTDSDQVEADNESLKHDTMRSESEDSK